MSISNIISKILIDNFKYFPKNTYNDIPSAYKKVYTNEKFDFYQIGNNKEKIVAAFNSVVVCKKNYCDSFSIYSNYCNRHLKFKVKFNNKIFPNLIDNSKINDILIIPYLKNTINGTKQNKWRVVVITDKAQIYHNFPARNDADNLNEKALDIIKFEESVIWDIPGRKYPSMNKNCDEVEQFFPHLPASCYDYHPNINEKSKYGNNGFGKETYVISNGNKIKVSRFYIPIRTSDANPFTFMGGFEPDYKMTLIGTYESNKNVGVRTCIFATSDGGRSWYAKMEFDDLGEYSFKQGNDLYGNNFGNKLINFSINKQESFAKNMYLQKRMIDYNNNEEKWGTNVEIIELYCHDTLTIRTKNDHNLETGNIVRIVGDNNENKAWEALLYKKQDKKDEINNLFKIKKIDNNTIELYEFVSNCESKITCRHIHHINRIRDGWIVGTGEIYPNGWLLYIQMKEADSYSEIKASDELKIVKLNTKKNSVQRTVGVDVIEKKNENMMIFASDHDKLFRTKNSIAGLSRGSTGVYIGKLNDIDDFNKFEILIETKEPAFFFKKLGKYYVFCGQRGEFIIFEEESYKKCFHANIDTTFFHYKGSTFSYSILDNYILRIKQ